MLVERGGVQIEKGAGGAQYLYLSKRGGFSPFPYFLYLLVNSSLKKLFQSSNHQGGRRATSKSEFSASL